MRAYLAALSAVVLAVLAVLVPAPARADETEQAAGGVVRVALIGTTYRGQVLLGTGSGFAVAPNLVVTNAHVVAQAIQFQTQITVTIVPPNGNGPVEGRVLDFDEQRDLALISVDGPPLRPLTLSMVPPRQGEAIVALGYPDIDDLSRPARELIQPTAPSRSSGAIASLRDNAPNGQPIPTINHEAAISSGSSGGPLLDGCGRVVGVNTWHARGQETFQGRGVATRTGALVSFLRDRGLEPTVDDQRCLSRAEQTERQLELAQRELEEARRGGAAVQVPASDSAEAAFWRNLPLIILISAVIIAIGLIALAIALMVRRNRR